MLNDDQLPVLPSLAITPALRASLAGAFREGAACLWAVGKDDQARTLDLTALALESDDPERGP